MHAGFEVTCGCVCSTSSVQVAKEWLPSAVQVAALAHDPQAMEEAREAVAEAVELLAVAKQQVAVLEAETKPLEQVALDVGAIANTSAAKRALDAYRALQRRAAQPAVDSQYSLEVRIVLKVSTPR